jgi:hypothetical protein
MIQIEDYSETVLKLLENDRKSFETVINNNELEGKLGFAQITTAMAAFDAFSYLLHQRLSRQLSNFDLFKRLLNDSNQFFDKSKVNNEEVFYKIIRCGVVHQLFPKNASIVAILQSTIFYQYNGALSVNAYGILIFVIEGLRKINAHLKTLSDQEKDRLSFMLQVRLMSDYEEYDLNKLNIQDMPKIN